MKATLITGASSGIGEAFARRLAEEKHNLVLVARSEEKLASLCDELMLEHGITAHYVAIDLNDYQADLRLFKETVNHGLEINWLINNAGFGSMGPFADLDLERELDMIGLNVMAVVALTHRYLGMMLDAGEGNIINVSSTAGFQPLPFIATYSATKAFVTSFTEAVAEEYRPYGIRMLALCPGATDTNFFDAAGWDGPFASRGMQTPEEVVEIALEAIERGKTTVVCGWSNYLVSRVSSIFPNSLVTKAVARSLRRMAEGKGDQADEDDS